MVVQSLNGTWMRRIGAGEESPIEVPYSTLPVGISFCRREIDIEEYERLFLRFDGITYRAEVFLNGESLGVMLPYCEYEFEISDKARVGKNMLSVRIEDLDLSFGPTPGWENFGGIVRDVSLIYRESAYIENIFFKSRLENRYRDAVMSADVAVNGPCEGEIEISLMDAEGEEIVSYRQSVGSTQEKKINNVSLWSPDEPALYTLSVKLLEDGRELDLYTCSVGFREINCDAHRFFLNGRPLFLKGVCKHEMIGDSGHTVSAEEIERDLRMIKETGSNFVRLVHYPHCKATLDIADRLGLMVSEEPGLWWSDTSDKEVAQGSLEVLRRTVRRDRNHPSIAFWLCFNECEFTEQFLIDSARVCRENDPTRLVSGANCMNNEDTLLYFNKCGLDFYTMHPYSATVERPLRSAEILKGKPLLFTEWGGYFVFDDPAYMRESMRAMARLYSEGSLAGAFLWAWADVNDFNRGAPCIDGVLPEGIVTKDRQRHTCYDTFCEEIAKMERYEEGSGYVCRQLIPIEGEAAEYLSGGESFDTLIKGVLNESRALPFRSSLRHREIKRGPVFESALREGMSQVPVALGNNEPIVYRCESEARKISLLGAVGFMRGYPISGALGEEIARVKVVYDGGEQSFVLRNGREVTTVFTTIGSSRIDPVADLAPRAAELSYDLNFEQYAVNLLTLELDEVKNVRFVEISSLKSDCGLLFYGCFLK